MELFPLGTFVKPNVSPWKLEEEEPVNQFFGVFPTPLFILEQVFASCSVDQSIRIWDIRAPPTSMISTDGAHSSDINVISWNQTEPFLLSGGDDGLLKVWDLRQFKVKTDPIQLYCCSHSVLHTERTAFHKRQNSPSVKKSV